MKNTVYDNGQTTWTHGHIIARHPNNAPERWLLGPCPQCGSVTSNYGSAFSCHDDYCRNSANVFACSPEKTPEWWNKGINVKRDGNAWCATGPGFVDLQASIAGFGDTPREAVADYLANGGTL